MKTILGSGGRAFFNPVGIAFIVAGSLSDAMAANYEEKVFFSRRAPVMGGLGDLLGCYEDFLVFFGGWTWWNKRDMRG